MIGKAQSSENGGANLVCLVIVLGVILEHFRLLGVLEVPDEIIDSEILPPLFVGNKPIAQWTSAAGTHTGRVWMRL
jgi:hypothetical protein